MLVLALLAPTNPCLKLSLARKFWRFVLSSGSLESLILFYDSRGSQDVEAYNRTDNTSVLSVRILVVLDSEVNFQIRFMIAKAFLALVRRFYHFVHLFAGYSCGFSRMVLFMCIFAGLA